MPIISEVDWITNPTRFPSEQCPIETRQVLQLAGILTIVIVTWIKIETIIRNVCSVTRM